MVPSNESEHLNVERIQENDVAVDEHNRDDDAVLIQRELERFNNFVQQIQDDFFSIYDN